MKRAWISFLFILLVTFSISAQGIYFDIGLGFGFGQTEIDGTNVTDSMVLGFKEFGGEVGLKLGYGPIAGISLYIVGEFSGITHVIKGFDDLQCTSVLIGPGIIFYPIPLIQFGASIGYSYVGINTNLPAIPHYGKGGIAWNVYVAIDLGKKNHGLLIGLKYTRANNPLEISEAETMSSLISLIAKYAYRHKI